MIVFSNTTPLIALSSIEQLDLLPRLFTGIHLVNEVIEECAVGGTITVPDLRALPMGERGRIHSHPIPHCFAGAR